MFGTVTRFTLGCVLSSALIFGAGCGEKPASGDCEKLLDHLIDLELSSAAKDTMTPEQKADLDRSLDGQKSKLHDHLKQKFMEQCMDQTPAYVVRCALKQTSHDQLESCR